MSDQRLRLLAWFGHPVAFAIVLALIATAMLSRSVTNAGPLVHTGRRQAVLPFHKWQSGDHPSPDGQYVANMSVGEAEIGYLGVYRAGTPARQHVVRWRSVGHPIAKGSQSPIYENAETYAWIPNRAHTLVIATGGADYGDGYLAIWSGGKRMRYLKRGKHPEDEAFEIISVAPDGRSLVYEFTDMNEKQSRHRLALP